MKIFKMETIPLKEKKWATYDVSSLPIINVKLKGKITSQEEFDDFTKGWLDAYEMNQKFTFIFDATEVGFVSTKYAFQMSDFIRKLKNDYDNRFLERSLILVNSFWVRSLLKLIFFCESPVAPVYVVNIKKNIDIETLINKIKNRSKLPNGVVEYKV